MRVIFIYGKKVTIFVTIVLFMAVVFVLEQGFHERLKLASLREVNIYSFREYKDDYERITYKLPEKWKNNEKKFDIGSIVYHSNFYDTYSSIGGYIQLLEKDSNLQDVVATMGDKDDIKEYNYRPIKVNGHIGYLVNYKIEGYTSSEELKFVKYYIDGDNERAVATFYISENNYDEDFDKVFDAIIETIEIK